MRIDRLDLMAFGPFSGQSLALEGGKCGLHIVYGTNEAGKSSALRALRQFLFGIPHNSSDNFIHSNTDMRIGARLRGTSGEVLECIRRKGKTNTLRTADESANVDPARLTRLLGGLDEIGFALQFGIDSAALEMGGRAIVEGKGELGAALFAAGSGIVDLRRVQEQLTAEAKSLFVPSGKVPVINKALSELAEAKKRVKATQLQTADWEAHDTRLKDATARRKTIDEQLHTRSAERTRWERIEKALPWVVRRKQALAEFAKVADAILLPEAFAETRRLTQTAVQTKQAAVQDLATLVKELTEQLAGLNPPQDLLQNRSVVTQLYEYLGAHRKAQADRPNLEKLRQSHRDAASDTLQALVPTADLSRAEALRVNKVERHKIQTLGQSQKGLASACGAEKQQLAELQAAIEPLEQVLNAEHSPPDPTPLRNVLRAFAAFREFDLRLGQDRASASQCEQQVRGALLRLPRWRGELEQLEALAVPSLETVDRFDSELNEAEREIKSLDQRIAQLDDNDRELDHNLERLRLARDVPTEDDLAKARQRRDDGWQLVRHAWERDDQDSADEAAFSTEFGSPGDLATAYETSVSHADSLSDRLRREADYVAQKAQFLASKQKVVESRERLVLQRGECNDRFADQLKRWQQLWQPLAIDPGSPREMRAWLGQHTQLVNNAVEMRRQQTALLHLEHSAHNCCSEFLRALSDCGQTPSQPTSSCSILYQHAESVADALEAKRAVQREREIELHRLKTEVNETRRRLQSATTDYEDWQNQWQLVTRRLELPADASPAAVNEVLASLDDLFDRLRQAQELEKRIEGIDRDASQFTQQLQEIAKLVGYDIAGQPADRAVSGLYDKLIAAQKLETRFEELRQQHEREQSRYDLLQREIQGHHAVLMAMCAEAGVKRIDDLPAAEERSSQRRRLEEQIRDFEDRLLDLAAGHDLMDFIAEAEATPADQIQPSRSRLNSEIEQMEQERTDIDRTIGSERLALQQMDGSAAAALAQEEAVSLAAQVRSAAEQYRRLKMSSAVLSRAIERYRERHQGPVVQLASKLFGRLTLGSFEGLRADYGDDGQAVLVGVRPGGRQTVAVEGMSSGARDQLYLALRLASLHTYLDTKEPIPFIVDDVLIQFDDERSVAALHALAELSSRTQVIFFTHHEHLVELAGTCLPAAVLYKHRLDCRSGSAGGLSSAGSIPAINDSETRPQSVQSGDKPARQKLFNSVPN